MHFLSVKFNLKIGEKLDVQFAGFFGIRLIEFWFPESIWSSFSTQTHFKCLAFIWIQYWSIISVNFSNINA